MEGVVIGLNKGKGKYKEMMGSLTLRLTNGIVFNLGTGFTDQLRPPPPWEQVLPSSTMGLPKTGFPNLHHF